MSNVPDDWNSYWTTCANCGNRYHMSEGGCDCYVEEAEQLVAKTFARLKNLSTVISGMTSEPATHRMEDDLGRNLNKGETEYRLYVHEADGCDELVFGAESWAELKHILKWTEDPPPLQEQG